ncbi:MAG: zf-HC2 domain-containing protein [Acidimicrobiales bacterium]
MNAAHPDDLLSARIDDELDPATAGVVDQHLDDCASCRRDMDAVLAARRALRAAPPVPAPAGLVRGLVTRRRRADRRSVMVAAAAAVLALVTSVASADPSAVTGSSDGDAQGQVQPDTRPQRDAPQGIWRASSTASSDPSLAERVTEAARDLLGFLG